MCNKRAGKLLRLRDGVGLVALATEGVPWQPECYCPAPRSLGVEGHSRKACYYCVLEDAVAPLSAMDVVLQELATDPTRSGGPPHWHEAAEGHRRESCYYCWLMSRVAVAPAAPSKAERAKRKGKGEHQKTASQAKKLKAFEGTWRFAG